MEEVFRARCSQHLRDPGTSPTGHPPCRAKPNTITFNAVIAACAKAGDGHRACEWLEKMKLAGILPNSFSSSSVSAPCSERSSKVFAWVKVSNSAAAVRARPVPRPVPPALILSSP